MIDLYSALRLNQFVLLIGQPLEGKTTVWKTIVKAINSLQNKETRNVIVFYFFYNKLQ